MKAEPTNNPDLIQSILEGMTRLEKEGPETLSQYEVSLAEVDQIIWDILEDIDEEE